MEGMLPLGYFQPVDEHSRGTTARSFLSKAGLL